MGNQYNLWSPAVKAPDARSQRIECSDMMNHAQPLVHNLFEWYFTLETQGYHGVVYFSDINVFKYHEAFAGQVYWLI